MTLVIIMQSFECEDLSYNGFCLVILDSRGRKGRAYYDQTVPGSSSPLHSHQRKLRGPEEGSEPGYKASASQRKGVRRYENMHLCVCAGFSLVRWVGMVRVESVTDFLPISKVKLTAKAIY